METALTDEEIDAQLRGESVRGPRRFRGKPLAPLTRGLKELWYKVINGADIRSVGDDVLIYILLQAQPESEKPEEKLAKRRALVAATDDPEGFRAMVSLWADELTDAEASEVGKLADEILGLVKLAEVVIDEKKSEGAAGGSAEPCLTESPSTGTISPA